MTERRGSRGRRYTAACVAAASGVLWLSGCHHASQGSQEVVYVVAADTWLRDRVAPVSEKVAEVHNGDVLKVLDQDRRFYQVKAPDGKTGWIEQHFVIDQPTYEQFLANDRAHAKDPVVATGVLSDQFYLHMAPGRDSDRYYLLPANDKLQLLQRASIVKLTPEQEYRQQQHRAAEARAAAAADRLWELILKDKGPTPQGPVVLGKAPAPPAPPAEAWVLPPPPPDPNAPPPVYQDWWLVRDTKGRTGWLLARRVDVDVPDEVVRYAEGKRIVGAYLLAKVADDDSPFPDHQAPEYLMVLSPFVDGLPYDYDRVRVLVWNARKHRYEGGLRLNDIAGYLPVSVGHTAIDPKVGPVPVFTLKMALAGAQPALDEATGRPVTVPTAEVEYQLQGENVTRVGLGQTKMPDLYSSKGSEQATRAAKRLARRRRR